MPIDKPRQTHLQSMRNSDKDELIDYILELEKELDKLRDAQQRDEAASPALELLRKYRREFEENPEFDVDRVLKEIDAVLANAG